MSEPVQRCENNCICMQNYTYLHLKWPNLAVTAYGEI